MALDAGRSFVVVAATLVAVVAGTVVAVAAAAVVVESLVETFAAA